MQYVTAIGFTIAAIATAEMGKTVLILPFRFRHPHVAQVGTPECDGFASLPNGNGRRSIDGVPQWAPPLVFAPETLSEKGALRTPSCPGTITSGPATSTRSSPISAPAA